MTNIFPIDNRPTDYEYCLMSRNAYHTGKDCTILESLDWSVVENREGKGGYFGKLFRNQNTRQLVLAHRGTNSWKGILEDLMGIVLKRNITGQKEEVHQFTSQIMEMVEKEEYIDYHVSFTGHSLGAVLATLSVFYIHHSNIMVLDKYVHVNAVTFECPGSLGVVRKLQPNGEQYDIAVEDLDIIVYVTYPNKINTFDEHIGTLYSINTAAGKGKSDSFYQIPYIRETHSIDNITEWFKLEQSGNTNCKRFLMTDWPNFSQSGKFFNIADKQNETFSIKQNVSEFLLKYDVHIQQNECFGKWDVLPILHFSSTTRDILQKFDEYSFVAKDNHNQQDVSKILKALYECYCISDNPSRCKFIIVNSDKLTNVMEKFKYAITATLCQENKPAHNFRCIFTKFMADNLKCQQPKNGLPQPTSFGLHKWWPEEKILINSFVERKDSSGTIFVDKIMKLMEESKCKNARVAQKVVISGMGGTGKTTLAKWFALTYETYYKQIIWFDCGEMSMEKSINRLAKELTIVTEQGEEKFVIKNVYDLFEREGKNCLFIFDNVEDESAIFDLLPRNSIHHCLITSRNKDWGDESMYGKIEVLELGIFSKTDANAFIAKNLKNSTDKNDVKLIEKLGKEFGYLPLALQIVMATINRSNISLKNYFEQPGEKTKRSVIRDKTPKDYHYHLTVLKSLEASITCIAKDGEHGQLAVKILNILAFLIPDNISGEMISELMTHSGFDFEVNAALILLENYSLITKSGDGCKRHIYNIHRLLQDVVKMRNVELEEAILESLLIEMQSIHSKQKNMYKTHIRSAWDHAVKYEHLIGTFSDFFNDIVQDRSTKLIRIKSIEFLTLAWSYYQTSTPKDEKHWERGNSLANSLAHALFKKGSYEKCIEVWESIQKFWLKETESSNEVANGNVTKNREISKQRLMARKFNLGVAYERQGNITKSLTLYTEVMDIPDSWSTGISNPIQMSIKSSFDDCNIILHPMDLDGFFPFKNQLRSKIVCLMLSAPEPELQDALKHFKEFEDYKMWGEQHSSQHIILAGLKLVTSICTREVSRKKRKTEFQPNVAWNLLKRLWEGFIYWSRSSEISSMLNCWMSVINYVDCIAMQLIETGEWSEVTIVFKMLYEIHIRLICLQKVWECGDEDKLQSISSVVIRKLEDLKRKTEADEIEKYASLLKINELVVNTKVYNGEPNENCKTRNENSTDSNPNQSDFLLKGSKRSKLKTFAEFKLNTKFNPNLLRNMHLKFVQLYKCELIWTLNQCQQLEKLNLEDVNIHGRCNERAYLPNLKVFVIDYFVSMWRDTGHSRIDLQSYVNGLSFFYKSLKNKDWELDTINSLALDTFKIAEHGKTQVEINWDWEISSIQCDVHDKHTDEFLKLIDFTPTKLETNVCTASGNSITRFACTVNR